MTITDRLHASALARALTVAAALCFTSACDKDADDKAADHKESGPSEQAQALDKEVAEMKAKLAEGEDIKYACAGNMGQYKTLATSDDDSEKKAHAALA
jgi:hypothetical protein